MDWNRLTLVTPPATPLISLDDAKLHCRVDTDDDDDFLPMLVAAAADYISGPNGIGRQLLPATWRLSLDGFPPCGVIRVELGPVSAITSVSYRDLSGALQTLDPSLYYVDLDARPARVVRAYSTVWPLTAYGMPGSVKVTFSAGEASPPADLIHAAKLLIGTWYEGREAIVGLDRTATPTDLPVAGVDAILSRYRTGVFG